MCLYALSKCAISIESLVCLWYKHSQMGGMVRLGGAAVGA